MRAFEEVVALYTSTVYGIALTRVQNKFDADDIFQEVFLTYHRKQPLFKDSEHEKAWIIRVTLICSKRFLSTRSKQMTVTFDETFHNHIELTTEDTELYDALSKLPELYRTVLYLYYFETLSVEEIATLLKRRSGTVRMQMSRGRELLKEIYERLSDDE